MAKKPTALKPLTLTEIILRGDAETIRQALEARVQIDTLLEEREAAYQKIAELETQVDAIVGETDTFPFPEPPMPVAGFAKTAAPKKKVASKPETKDEGNKDDTQEHKESPNIEDSTEAGEKETKAEDA